MAEQSAGTMERTPRLLQIDAHGVAMACYEWEGTGRPILLVHATGFHARCWDQVVALLPDRHCYAVDLRGHGRSAKPPPPYHWPDFGRDLVAISRVLDLRGALGVGHSCGGYAITLAAAALPAAFAALLLIDPSILSRERYGRSAAPSTASFVLKRRNWWTSPEEMITAFAERHPFRLWRPSVLRDYCTYGLLPAPQGEGYVLACPPEVEAAVYAATAEDDIYDTIHGLPLPVRVLRARQRGAVTPGGPVDMSFSPTAPDLASHFPSGDDLLLPELSHYLPMEAPEVVAQQIQAMGW